MLAVDTTEARDDGDDGTRTHIGLVASEVLFRLSDVPGDECGRVESNHHSTRRQGYSLLSSPLLSVRMNQRRWPAGFEPAPTGLTTPDASVYTTATMKRGRPDSNRRPLA